MINIDIVERKQYNAQELVRIRMTNPSGSYVEITNIGASVVAIVVPDKHGISKNIVLSYDRLEDYLIDKFYLGSTVGRFANRISGASFSLNSITYQLDKNDGNNSNHGGFNGFNSRIFDYHIEVDKVVFKISSKDGEGGFPGNLNLQVIYRFSPLEDRLTIEYKSISDATTPVNYTNHTYFNLDRYDSNIWSHKLKINSSTYLEMNDQFLPTGKKKDARSSAFDFTTFSLIGDQAKKKRDNLAGFNVFYEKESNNDLHKPIATIREMETGRYIDLYSSMSGVQLYTGDFLSDPFHPFAGVCIEAQYHPDGLSHHNFDRCILQPHVEKTNLIEYYFYTKE